MNKEMLEVLEFRAKDDPQAIRYLDEIKKIENDGGFEGDLYSGYECHRTNCIGCLTRDAESSFRCMKWTGKVALSADISDIGKDNIKRLMGEI